MGNVRMGDVNDYTAVANYLIVLCRNSANVERARIYLQGHNNLNSQFLRNILQEELNGRNEPGDVWYWTNYCLGTLAGGGALTIPPEKKWSPATRESDAAFGPGRDCPAQLPLGPDPLDSQFEMLSQRVSQLHAFVLSQQ